MSTPPRPLSSRPPSSRPAAPPRPPTSLAPPPAPATKLAASPLAPSLADEALLRAIDALASAAQSGTQIGPTLATLAENVCKRVAACVPNGQPVHLLFAGGAIQLGPRLLRLPRALRVQAMVLTELMRARGGDVAIVAANARAEDWMALARRLAPGARVPPPPPGARVRLRPAVEGLVERLLDEGAETPTAAAARAWGSAVVSCRELLDRLARGEGRLGLAIDIARTLARIGEDGGDEADVLADTSFDDPAAVAARGALGAIALAQRLGAAKRTRVELGAAALMQGLAERVDGRAEVDAAAARLFALARAEPRGEAVAVIAYEAIRLRAGVRVESVTTEARIVVAAWDEARGSLVDLAPASITEVDATIPALDQTGRDGRPSLDLAGGPIPIASGTLDGEGLPALLANAWRHRFSGSMVLTEPTGTRHAIVFAEGAPVRARAHRSPSLGDALTSTCGLSAALVRDALARAAVKGLSAIHVLIDEGTIDARDAARALGARTAARIGAIASLPPTTTHAWYAGRDVLAETADAEHPVAVDPRCAILVAARRTRARGAMNAALRRISGELALAPHVEPRQLAPTPAEQRVLDAIASVRAPLSEHLARERFPVEVARPVLYALMMTDGLESEQPAAE